MDIAHCNLTWVYDNAVLSLLDGPSAGVQNPARTENLKQKLFHNHSCRTWL